MTSCSFHRTVARGFSLLEISLVIALLLVLSTFAGLTVTSVRNWQRGKDAALSLQAVFAAQRAYLADHPTANIALVSSAQLQDYLPQGWSSMPTFTGLNNEVITLDHTVMPPRLYADGSVYDPSGKPNDGLWDTGK
jgi:prepilin-type N-terminal cleavage/methylation domain-containing protein